jgi:hypothetical protein
METVKLYVLEQQGVMKGFVVANNISEAATLFQAKIDSDNVNEDFWRTLAVIRVPYTRADWVIEVTENYKESSEQAVLTKPIVAERFDVFELDFSFNQVYGLS